MASEMKIMKARQKEMKLYMVAVREKMKSTKNENDYRIYWKTDKK